MRPTWLALVVLLLLAVAAVAAACQREEEVANPRSQELLQTPSATPTPTVPPATPPPAARDWANARVGTVRKITSDGRSGVAAWSADGSRLFISKGGPKNFHGELWTVAVDGTDPRQVLENGPWPFFLAFSSDGTSIAFGKRESLDETIPLGEETYSILTASADGSGRRTVASGKKVWGLDWLDSSHILLLEAGQFRVLDLATGTERIVGGQAEFDFGRVFALSPDRSKVAFQIADPNRQGGVGVLDLAAGTVTPIPNSRLLQEAATISWSPDGTRLVFAGNPGELHIASADGSAPAQHLLFSADLQVGRFLWTTWTRDGGAILFITGQMGIGVHLSFVRPDGSGGHVALTDLSSRPALLSPDNSLIAFTHSSEDAAIGEMLQ